MREETLSGFAQCCFRIDGLRTYKEDRLVDWEED